MLQARFDFCLEGVFSFVDCMLMHTIYRLTTVMAVAHIKDINHNTEFYYEMMNASLYHSNRVPQKVATKVATHDGMLETVAEAHGHEHGHKGIPKPEKEPHLVKFL